MHGKNSGIQGCLTSSVVLTCVSYSPLAPTIETKEQRRKVRSVCMHACMVE